MQGANRAKRAASAPAVHPVLLPSVHLLVTDGARLAGLELPLLHPDGLRGAVSAGDDGGAAAAADLSRRERA